MGNLMQRIKIGLYIFVIVLVGALFVVRAHNAVQKTNYFTRTIEDDGDVQISLSYPAKILSPRTEMSYPLTISFSNYGDLSPVRVYEFAFESSTLLFMDSKEDEVSPRLQITSNYDSIEKNIYIRPFLAETYPSLHQISVKVFLDGQELKAQPDPIDIKTEPRWFSYLSLVATSILEISIASALVTWIANALDTTWSSRKELLIRRQDEIRELIFLPVLERMRRLIDLENKIKSEHLEKDLNENIHRIKNTLSEIDFLQAVGEYLRQGRLNDLTDIETLYDYFFKNHKESISALAKIINNLPLGQPLPSVILKIVKLWDEFDIDVKDLIVGALVQLPKQGALRKMPAYKIEQRIFKSYDRRRLLRIEELRNIFPQLVDSKTGKPIPIGYDATWLNIQNIKDKPQIIDWLGQHYLVTNPFGYDEFENYPYYPEGFASPDQWETFLGTNPLLTHCSTAADAKAIAFLLRDECFPTRKDGQEKIQVVESKRQVFPIMVSFQQTVPMQMPLPTLAHSAARTWLDILPLCTDALLDLSLADQQALFELLCWSVGSNSMVIDLIKRNGLKENKASRMLIRKITEFENKYSSAHLPQDAILLSWLKVRPPDLNHTYLILPADEFHTSASSWWFEQFSSSVSTLFLNGIVTKVLASTALSTSLPLTRIELSWSDGLDGRLNRSLGGQFEAAMDPGEKSMGKSIRFHELFGPGVTEEETTQKLISASHNSLAYMLMIGNRLLQKHCERDLPEKYLSPEELNDILTTI